MEILNNLSKMLWPRKNNIVLGVLAFVSLIGFLDATYLSLEHFRGSIPPCAVVSGCETVLTSSYATIGFVPVALLGAIYYVTVLFGCVLVWQTKNKKIFLALARFTGFGFLASLYFTSIQAFVLKTWCVYCMGSIVSSVILFIVGVYTIRKHHTF